MILQRFKSKLLWIFVAESLFRGTLVKLCAVKKLLLYYREWSFLFGASAHGAEVIRFIIAVIAEELCAAKAYHWIIH